MVTQTGTNEHTKKYEIYPSHSATLRRRLGPVPTGRGVLLHLNGPTFAFIRWRPEEDTELVLSTPVTDLSDLQTRITSEPPFKRVTDLIKKKKSIRKSIYRSARRPHSWSGRTGNRVGSEASVAARCAATAAASEIP